MKIVGKLSNNRILIEFDEHEWLFVEQNIKDLIRDLDAGAFSKSEAYKIILNIGDKRLYNALEQAFWRHEYDGSISELADIGLGKKKIYNIAKGLNPQILYALEKIGVVEHQIYLNKWRKVGDDARDPES